MKGIIIYYLDSEHDQALIEDIRKKFSGRDLLFIDNTNNNIFPQLDLGQRNEFIETSKFVVIDSRQQCCSLNLAHNVAHLIKNINKSALILALVEHEPVDIRSIDSLVKVEGTFAGNHNFIFTKLGEWLA